MMPVTLELSQARAAARSRIGLGDSGSSHFNACSWPGARSNSELTHMVRVRWLTNSSAINTQASLAADARAGAMVDMPVMVLVLDNV